MKSDGDLVSIASFDQENGKSSIPYFTSSSYPTCGTENHYFDSLAASTMVPCKQKSAPSSPNYPHYKESDSNGNDIRNDKNLNNSLCGEADADKTDVSHLTTQVTELQRSLSALQEETDTTITKLKQELADKANIVETLQQQIRMKMFMNLTREKNLQANPMMAALADMQGNPQAQIGRGGGLVNVDNFGVLNEEMLSSWRKNLEQSLFSGFPFGSQERGTTPGSPNTTRSETPHTDRQTPLDGHLFNQNDSKTPSEDGRLTPARSEESASPTKVDEGVSPTPSPIPSSFATPSLVPKSFANTVHTGSQLSIPPLFTSRIPKGDPLEERLHDMLRIPVSQTRPHHGNPISVLARKIKYNMEKFAGQPIDTLADSRRVRELLSVHNIGQRLFAKYVLGLSQGTVSELLSKPKSWDKLTEKGRDSYRKMHAWVWDDQAILLLKTLIPRKGELLRSSSSIKQESEREDRNSEHRINKILSEVNKSHENLLPKFPSMENPQVSQSLLLPNLPTSQGSEDLKMALSFYQNEINQLQKLPHSEHFEPENHPSEDSDKDSVKEEKENQDKEDFKNSGPFSMLQAKLDQSFGQVRPSLPPSQGLFVGPHGFGHSLDSPLQRMASITNSLVSQPLPSPHFGQRPLKAVLPPITQQQFDHFSHLNTDETVRRIKEILSQYSISQRLFGEAVLGLSQGSVSDLLARPKPWHMLTQKGREPFIRMKLFLDDDSAIHKLVASQYKIVPDKLLRTGAYSGSPILPQNKLTTTHPRLQGLPDPFRSMTESPLPALIPNSNRLPHQILPNLDRSLLSGLPGMAQRPLLPTMPHLTPNLYEMAALTQEFDTTGITNKVKELLLANNMGQKLFGEAVLGLSQGSVSELLSKPKPWHMLSIKGREPFIRMQLWLNDPNNIDKLMAIKQLQDETRKRKRTFDDSFSGKSSPSDISDLYSNPGLANSPGDNESKKTRESGLDLSFKRDDDEQNESDGQDEAMVTNDDEGRETESDDGNLRQNYQGGGRSRRKPAAPQWLNPDWSEEPETNKAESMTINGVCVMNAGVFKPEEEKNGEWEKSGED